MMEPEQLWEIKEVLPVGISQDKKYLFYKLKIPVIAQNSFKTEYYQLDLKSKKPRKTTQKRVEKLLKDRNVSPDSKYKLFHKTVPIRAVVGKELYKNYNKNNAYVIDSLDYKCWDKWNDGTYNHVFYRKIETGEEVDIMSDEPYYCPQMPFGDETDYLWDNSGKAIYYVSKKEAGTSYAISTNTDIYCYSLEDKKTVNITKPNPGYDTQPAFSKEGVLAWLRMKTPGYEADKNDIVVKVGSKIKNLTQGWDGTVQHFLWSEKAGLIFFIAPIDGTKQVFKLTFDKQFNHPKIEQLTNGDFDINQLIVENEEQLYVLRSDMNHANEIFALGMLTGEMMPCTFSNEAVYQNYRLPHYERRYVQTQDGHKMLVWVVFPPDFDKNKKYPTLLYCQGGPQSPLTQFYSRRWNFQLMASRGYIVVAPNRRGMQGHGVAWNAMISKNWGKAMQDYIDAIDSISKESYVDKKRIGAIGASFGGYSVFWLAGHHQKRFKTFIAHDGVFDTRSMYGTTEEVFFPNYDLGGAYWEKNNPDAQRAYHEYNPINYVANWDTPIMIIQGEKDYRVSVEQGLSAFQVAQLRGIKSRLLYFTDEGHWVTKPQNGLVWQHEFFKWLSETL